jgi:hypothetical protein
MFKTFHHHWLALELLNRHARISIIHKETGIPQQTLRNAYRHLHGKSAPAGALKFSTGGLTRNLKNYKEVTLFAVCFKSVHARSQETVIQKTINAFDLFKRFYPDSRLDFSGTWVIAKDIVALKVQVASCQHCNSAVLLHAREDGINRCTICKTNVQA